MARRYYLEDLALDEAWRRFEQALERAGGLRGLASERVTLADALGRTTSAPIWARLSSPHYHAAAMDGVAVRATDTFGASETSPRRLAVGRQAIWVDTGDPLPPDSDAVIMAEHVQTIDEHTIEILAAVAPWQHVRPMGEDIVATELVLPEHHLLRPVDLGALAAAGHVEVEVRRRPRVAIIPTGTELVSLQGLGIGDGGLGDNSQSPISSSQPIAPGAIIEFNSLILAGQVAEWGGLAERYPPVPDRRDLLRAAVERGLTECDLVVVNAGSSAGSEDYTAAVLAELGEVAVHGVAIRPGHPAILAVAQGKPVLGLPGYPVSTTLTSELFLQPLLYRMQGQPPPRRPTIAATLSRKVHSPAGEDEFVRVTLGQVGERMVAAPLARGAGVVMSLVHADGLLRIPRFSEGFHAGADVEVELLRDPSELAGTIVAIGSHDLALDLLSSHLRRFAPNARLVSANAGSLGGLLALKRGDAHLAGTHLLDEATGAYNRPFLARLLPDMDVLLVELAGREQGLIVAPGNPQRIRDLEDLARPGVRFVNRQKGAGTRVLLDYHLKQRGIPAERVAGYEREEYTHMAVAAAVLSGSASAGMGILAAARALGLDFIPLFKERYELAIPRQHWDSSLLMPLRQALESAEYRQAVAGMGGYDVERMGQVSSESHAR